MKEDTTLAWKVDTGAAENARRVLPPLASDLFAAGRKAVEGEIKLKRLHKFRLKVKRFRYTIEVFRPLYGPAMDQRLAGLRELQDHLGIINDCDVARRLIKSSTGKKTPKVREALRHIAEVEQRRVEEYLVFWKEVFDAAPEEARWVSYLQQYAGRRKAVSGTAAHRAVASNVHGIGGQRPAPIH